MQLSSSKKIKDIFGIKVNSCSQIGWNAPSQLMQPGFTNHDGLILVVLGIVGKYLRSFGAFKYKAISIKNIE